MRDAEREADEARRSRRIGEFIESLEGSKGSASIEGDRLVGFQMRMPTEEEPSALLIVRVASEKGRRIAFVGAFSAADAMLAWRARVKAGKMKWREDVPWAERQRS
jgi:hypothetical protein